MKQAHSLILVRATFLAFTSSPPNRYLHSFPTRRSSDLVAAAGQGYGPGLAAASSGGDQQQGRLGGKPRLPGKQPVQQGVAGVPDQPAVQGQPPGAHHPLQQHGGLVWVQGPANADMVAGLSARSRTARARSNRPNRAGGIAGEHLASTGGWRTMT